MAQQFVDENGNVLTDPGTYVTPQVASTSSGVATSGVITIVGEADQGPGWEDEADITQNYFSPSQFGQVQAKYVSGNIVNAFNAMIAAANDPAITGAVTQVNIVKTNRSLAAAATVARSGFGSYANLAALLRGQPGNLTNWLSQVAVAEEAPNTGAVSYAPIITGDVDFALRANGSPLEPIVITPKMAPNALAAEIENYQYGIMCTGGSQAQPLTGLSGIVLSATLTNIPTQLIIQLAPGSLFSTQPSIGDILIIPADTDYGAPSLSVIAGAGSANVGTYIVTNSVNTPALAQITVTALNIVGPSLVAVSAAISSGTQDILTYKPIDIANMTGQNRAINVGLLGQYTIVSNDTVNVVLQTPAGLVWAAAPQIGDTVVFATAFGGINSGFYEVASATANTISFYRLSNGSAGTTSAPANIATPITAGNEPFICERPVIDGLGKSLEIDGNVEGVFLNPKTQAGAGLSNQLLVSAAEYENQFTIAQSGTSQSFQAGGTIALEIGCTSELATVVVNSTGLTFKVGATTQFTATYSQFQALSDLMTYINSQTGWNAMVPLAQLLNLNPDELDWGTYAASSAAGFEPARIKNDASAWLLAVTSSTLASEALVGQSGLPDASQPATPQFFAGGAKAGTSSLDVVNAIDACEELTTNFVITLFSQNASLDVAAGLTDPTSTYTIAAIDAYLKSHVLAMSAVTARANREGLCSIQDTYANVKQQAGQLNSFRIGLCFQQVQITNASTGPISTFQPWMASCIAGGMQAAAGYRGIVKKFANVSNVITPDGDWSPKNYGNRVDALQAGLLFMEPVSTGGIRWTSDQMTYTTDNNFVYNSLQAVYVSDLVILSLIDTFNRSIVGNSVADITASSALSVLAGAMFNYKRLKYIAPSDDAPQGYKNAKSKLNGGVLQIWCEIKLAGLIYFVPIYLTISQVQQSASSAG